MIQMYPLNMVVSNDQAFIQTYNSNDSSAFLMSQCCDVEKFKGMLEQGAKFDFIACVNGEGSDLVKDSQAQDSWEMEFQPRVDQFNVDPSKTPEQLVEELHSMFAEQRLVQGGMG